MKLFAALLLPVLASAAILPEAIGPYRRASTGQPAISDTSVWKEYGLKESETAVYRDGSTQFTAMAWRLQDPTSALAAFDWQRPANAVPSNAAPLAAATADGLMLVHGQYLLSFTGYTPNTAELQALTDALRNVDTGSLPTLPGFVPSRNLVPDSERYIVGPESLRKFVPAVPPSVAAFRMGAEAETAVFHSPKGDLTLTVFNYPTPQIAMAQTGEFEKLAGAMVKRSGPLVAVILSPQDRDAAERLLADVRYEAQVTRDEYVPTPKDNIGDMILTIFSLIGILLVICLISGLSLGGFRVMMRYVHKGEEPEPVISLHLERR
jgi:hypothetical protein